MNEVAGLSTVGQGDVGMGMADGGDAKGGGHVEVGVSVAVGDPAARGFLPEDRNVGGDLRDVRALVASLVFRVCQRPGAGDGRQLSGSIHSNARGGVWYCR